MVMVCVSMIHDAKICNDSRHTFEDQPIVQDGGGTTAAAAAAAASSSAARWKRRSPFAQSVSTPTALNAAAGAQCSVQCAATARKTHKATAAPAPWCRHAAAAACLRRERCGSVYV